MTTSPTRIRPATPADAPFAGALFHSYPFKKSQQSVQRIDRFRLETYFRNALARALDSNKPLWLAFSSNNDENPIALAGLSDPTWHSDIYNLNMARIEPWINTLHPESGPPLLDAVESAAREKQIQHLSIRIDAEDFQNLHLLESRGWKTVDISMKFSRAFQLPIANPSPANPSAPPSPSAPPLPDSLTVALASPADHDWIRILGSTTHGGTHFLNDPALDPEKTKQIFAAWLDKCLTKLAYRVYVLKDSTGRGIGFVTYLRNESFAAAAGRRPLILDFVLIDPAHRGKGLGPILIAKTLELESSSGFDYCELRTSMHNLSAVIAYEKLGFLCCASDFALHKTLEPVS